MSETSTVSGRSAARSCSGVTRPSSAGVRNVTAKPSRSSCRHGSSTALCSVREVITCGAATPPARAARAPRALPRIARLSASVAPEVKMTSGARAPISAATWARAASTRARAARPKLWVEAGLPNTVSAHRHSAMQAATRASTGVVAA